MLANHLHGLFAVVYPALEKLIAAPGAALHKANPSAPRAARRKWSRKLEAMGRFAVEEQLNSVAMLNLSRTDVVRFIDIGVTHGRHRFPTRQFVESWLGDDSTYDEEVREAEWRLRLALVAVVALIVGGIPVLV